MHIASDNNNCMVRDLAKKSILDALEVRVSQELATIHSYDHIMSLLQSRSDILQLAIVLSHNS